MTALKSPCHPLFRKGIGILLSLIFVLMLIPAHGIAHDKDKSRWDSKYDTETYIFGITPIPFLIETLSLLPNLKTLDIAMGEGRHGVFLAANLFDVLGLDISAN